MRPAGRWHARRLLAVVGLAFGGFIVVGGVLHLPVARPLLARLGAPCPVRAVSAAEVDAARGPALAALRGEADAPSRPALGLRLDATTVAEVRGWASDNGISCVTPPRASHLLACSDVPAEALGLRPSHGGRVPDVAFAFDAKGVLVAVDALRRGLSPRDAADAGASLVSRLAADLGAPGERAGEWTAEHLDGPMRTSVVRFRFRDYVAVVTATHVPGSGVILREQYLSVGTPSV